MRKVKVVLTVVVGLGGCACVGKGGAASDATTSSGDSLGENGAGPVDADAELPCYEPGKAPINDWFDMLYHKSAAQPGAEEQAELACPLTEEEFVTVADKVPYLVLGGNPAAQTVLPAGAQCPSGFECLPTPSPWNSLVCDFQPTCFGQFPALAYSPTVYKGKYVLTPWDQLQNAHPLSALDAALDGVLFDTGDTGAEFYQTFPSKYGSTVLRETYKLAAAEVLVGGKCPAEHLTAPDAEQIEPKDAEHPIECKYKEVCGLRQIKPACTSPPDAKRDVLVQYGRFVQYVVFKDFKGVKNCHVVTWTYCCGPVLMLEPEDIKALLSAPNLCSGTYDEPTYVNVVSKSMKEAGLVNLGPIYDWCSYDADAQGCWDLGPATLCLDDARAMAYVTFNCEPISHCSEVVGGRRIWDRERCEFLDVVERFYRSTWFMAYAMERDQDSGKWYYTLVPCKCTGRPEGGIGECDFDKPLWHYETGEIMKFEYRPPEELFAHIPDYQDGCQERLAKAFAPEGEQGEANGE